MKLGRLSSHPNFIAALRAQANKLIETHLRAPRAGSIMATHQRYMMAHIAMAMYFRSSRAGIHVAAFLDAVESHGVVARNTADSFLKELERYRFIERRVAPNDKRLRPIVLTENTIALACHWFKIHLETLDMLDEGGRAAHFAANPDLFDEVQPLIAETLVNSIPLSEPAPTFSLFTWLDDGSIIMDFIFAHILEPDDTDPRWRTDTPQSVTDLARLSGLSITHLSRKLAVALKMESLGWIGRPGRSPFWISDAFRAEYLNYQTAKLTMIEAALNRTVHGAGILHPRRPGE